MERQQRVIQNAFNGVIRPGCCCAIEKSGVRLLDWRWQALPTNTARLVLPPFGYGNSIQKLLK